MKLFIRNLFVSCMAMCALLVWTGCATTGGGDGYSGGSGTNAPVGVGIGTTSDIIRPSEQITIELLDTGSNVQKLEQSVADDGTITLPMITNRVQAAGLKEPQLQDAIRDLYVPRYYKRMTVNIKRENRFFWVRGEVKSSGQRPYTGDMTLTKAIAAAGDFTEYANRTNIEIIRGNGVVTKVKWKDAVKNPKKHDLPIYPGDTVHVHQSIW